MEQFSLDKWLENPSRKVVVEKGYEVKIISTEAPGNCPIVGYIYNGYSGEIWLGPYCWNKKGISPRTHEIDLFFADDELTEFEKMLRYVLECYCGHEFASESEIETLKLNAKSLLNLARKELQPEFDKEMDNLLAETDKVVYQKGQQDALKDLPKLEKTKYVMYDPTIPVMYTNAASMKTYVEYNGYKLCINDAFEKLQNKQ